MSRLEANRQILKDLATFFEKHPDIRFVQGLWALGIISEEDQFYLESVVTKVQVQQKLAELGLNNGNRN